MKKILMIFTALLFGSLLWGCFDYAIDEDGLLVSEDGGCYVLNFDLIDTDQKTVKSSVYPPVIDTTSCTIDIYVVYGAVLDNVYPRFSLYLNCKLEPKITGRMDLSDMQPRQWDVISGNRKVRKTYTVYFHEEEHIK
ncbi:MAG: hypothetical protein J6K78_07135 [Tidjanibacter sp.]|nr:hypothetical protein [Tidjanibacter sp.]